MARRRKPKPLTPDQDRALEAVRRAGAVDARTALPFARIGAPANALNRLFGRGALRRVEDGGPARFYIAPHKGGAPETA